MPANNGLKISVALCSYNGAQYIAGQINSILSQTRLPDEIILSDDGSTDGTPEVAEGLLKPSGISFLILRSEVNAGVVENFSKALRACTGEIIMPCDQDDVWLENKVETLEKVFLQDPHCLLSFSDAYLTDAGLAKSGRALWQSLNFSPAMLGPGRAYPDLFTLLLNRCVVTGTAMAFRRELLETAFPFSENWIHDGWLAILAACTGKVTPVDEKLLLYRQHGGNVVGANDNHLVSRSKRYLGNFAKIQALRQKRRDRYKDALDRLSGRIKGSACEHELNACIDFWESKLMLKDAGLLKGTAVILADLRNAGYSRFYNGLKGAARDFACLFHKAKDEIK